MSGLNKTKFSRVNAVIKSIELEPKIIDKAESEDRNFLYQLRAAGNVKIFEPYTEEQDALKTYLSQRQAGRKLCDYAWRLYAQSL